METGNQHTKRTRLMIDISPELRRRIKIAAARDDLSIKDYVEHILEQAVPAEATEQIRRPITREALEELDKVREAIKRNLPPGYVFEDSVETLRQLREERTRQLEGL